MIGGTQIIRGDDMSVCIHGNLCREIYKKTGYIHSHTCPSNCKYYEEKKKVKNENKQKRI